MERAGLVLVAGAGGKLGMEVVRELKARGQRVRAMVRSEGKADRLRALADEVCLGDAMRPETLPAAMQRVDRVFSCVGASVIPMPQYGRATFTRLDYPANRNLIEASKAADVRKWVYVSVFGHRKVPHRDFIRGHELVVEELRQSGLDYSVLRPTGFFSAMEEILQVASRGLLPEVNGGTARTNPIHEVDLARACVEAFDAPPGTELDLGGPDPLTRSEIAQLALQAVGKEGKHLRVPVSVLRAAGLALRPFNPRVGHLFTFIADILVEDFVAPCYGTHHIADYFRERAVEMRSASASA
jgi:uncharacterized protein YbjT (DUF2867 family)